MGQEEINYLLYSKSYVFFVWPCLSDLGTVGGEKEGGI